MRRKRNGFLSDGAIGSAGSRARGACTRTVTGWRVGLASAAVGAGEVSVKSSARTRGVQAKIGGLACQKGAIGGDDRTDIGRTALVAAANSGFARRGSHVKTAVADIVAAGLNARAAGALGWSAAVDAKRALASRIVAA